MRSLLEKKDLILQSEERFALALAREVIETPKLNIWMILIPIILVYHVYQNRKVMDGRKEFAQNYLIIRKRALDESLALVEKGRRPEIDEIVRDSNLPEEARGPFKEIFSLLVEHYADLLRSDGPDMVSVVRSAYKTHTNYLLFLNRLNQAEKALNSSLRPFIEKSVGTAGDVMKEMEVRAEALRRESAARIFS